MRRLRYLLAKCGHVPNSNPIKPVVTLSADQMAVLDQYDLGQLDAAPSAVNSDAESSEQEADGAGSDPGSGASGASAGEGPPGCAATQSGLEPPDHEQEA